MQRVKKPAGLIRYGSQERLENGVTTRFLRPRVVIYAAAFGLLLTLLVASTLARPSAEVIVLRGLGAPFELRDGMAVNQIRIKVQNLGGARAEYNIELLDAPGARLIAPENPLPVSPREQRSTSVFVMIAPSELAPNGQRPVQFRVSDGRGFERTLKYRLLGPERARP
jgi:polyferredoxin